jgi:hypothetical protein
MPTEAEAKAINQLGRTPPAASAADLGAISAAEVEHAARMGLGGAETLGRRMTRAQRRVAEEVGEGMARGDREALASLHAKIGPTVADSPGNMGDKIRQALVDDFHHILRAERDLFGRQISNGAYETARKLRGIPNITEGLVKWGVPEWNADGSLGWTGQSLQSIMAPVAGSRKSLRKFESYAVARQAKELKDQGRERLFTDREIEAGMRLEKPEFREAFTNLTDYQKRVADFAEQAGLFSAEQRAAWRRNEYAFGFFRERGQRKRLSMGPELGGGDAVRTLRGSKRNLRDPIENMIEGPARLIQLALENRARKRVAMFAEVDTEGAFIKKIPPGSKRIRLNVANLEETMRRDLRNAVKEELGQAPPPEFLRRATRNKPHAFEGKIAETMGNVMDDQLQRIGFEAMDDLARVPGMIEVLNYFRGGQKPFGENVMTIFKNGKPEYYEVLDDGLARSLQAFRRPQLMGIRKWLNQTRRLVQSSVTMDPTFMVRNATRDMAMSSIMTRTGFQHLTEVPRAYWATIRKTPEYRDFIANGGGGASFYDGGASLRRSLVKHAQRTNFNPRGLLVTPGDVYRVLDRIGRVVEEAPRVAEYKRAVRTGQGKGRGAFLGREITTDFSVQGDYARLASQTIPFFNAMIAGGDRLYRSVVRDPQKRAVTGAKMAMVPIFGAALHMMNQNIKEYGLLPDWDKWTYWHWFIPNKYLPTEMRIGDGEYSHYKMPKLWEVGAMSSVTERAIQEAMGQTDPDQALWKDTGKIIMDNFAVSAPVGIAQVIEQARGKRTFTGERIEPMGIASRSPWARSKTSTSETFRALGRTTRNLPRWAQIPPARAEALYRGLFNAWAMHSLDLMDDALFPDRAPAKHNDQKMISRAFIERPGKYNRYVGKFYDLTTQMHEIHADVKYLAESQDPMAAADLGEQLEDPKKAALNALDPAARRAEKVVREYKSAMDAIRGDATMSPEEKRDRIEQLRLDREQYMEEMYRSFAEIVYQ